MFSQRHHFRAQHFAKRFAFILAFACLLSLQSVFAQEKKSEPLKPRLVEISGRIVDLQGKPVVGASVKVWMQLPSQAALPQKSEIATLQGHAASPLQTDFEGRFRAMALVTPNHLVGVSVEKEGWSSIHSSFALASSLTPNSMGPFTMLRLRRIKGKVLDRDGKPIGDVEVFQSRNSQLRTVTKTNANGDFALDGVPESYALIFARKPDYRFGGSVVAAGEAPVKLILAREKEPIQWTASPAPLTFAQEKELAKRIAEPIWKAALKTGNRERIFSLSHSYAQVDPWAVVDSANANGLPIHPAFAPLFEISPTEALALAHGEKDAMSRASAMFGIYRSARLVDSSKRNGLLESIITDGKSQENPSDKLYYLCFASKELFDIGETARAKALLEEIRPAAMAMSSEDAKGRFSELLAYTDFAAGQKIAAGLKSSGEWEIYHLRLGYAAANRCPADAMDAVKAIYQRVEQHNREYAVGKQSYYWTAGFEDAKVAAVCHRMAAVDIEKSIAVANMMVVPQRSAYAKRLIALEVSKTDKKRARAIIESAFQQLQKCRDSEQIVDATNRDWMGIEECNVAASMLSTIERIDSSLIPEYVWKTAALRLDRRHMAYFQNMTGFRCAALIAPFNREVAKVLFDREYCDFSKESMHSYWVDVSRALAAVDPNRLEKFLLTIPKGEKLGNGQEGATFSAATFLTWPIELRNQYLTIRSRYLWRPEHSLQREFGLAW